jgi:quaternary ammonium compound-resistance protein SugE
LQKTALNNTWQYWAFLAIAALFEAAWTFSLKYMQFSDLKKLSWHNFYQPGTGLRILIPFAGYIFFGIANVYFFSLATKQIPIAVAFAVWTGISIVLIKVAEVSFLQQKIIFTELFFILLIMAGIIGLKTYNGQK